MVYWHKREFKHKRVAGDESIRPHALFEVEISLPPVNLTWHETIASFKAVCGRIIARRPDCFRRMPKTGGAGSSDDIGDVDRLDHFG